MLKHIGEIAKEIVDDMKENIIVKRSKQDESRFVVIDRLYIRESGIVVEKRFKGKLIGHGDEEYDIKQIQLVNGNEYCVLNNVIRIKEYAKIIDKDGNEVLNEIGPSIISINEIKSTESFADYYKGQKWLFNEYTMNDGTVRYALDVERNL